MHNIFDFVIFVFLKGQSTPKNVNTVMSYQTSLTFFYKTHTQKDILTHVLSVLKVNGVQNTDFD